MKTNTRKFDVQYYSTQTGEKRWSHKYTEEWEKLDIHCPKCAEKDVWHNTGPGDCYVDEQYMCTSCGATFYMPNGVRKADDEQDVQRLEHLKEPCSALQKDMTMKRPIIDHFRGDNDHLKRSIEALIRLGDDGALVPVGLCGHARALLAAAYHRLPKGKPRKAKKPGV